MLPKAQMLKCFSPHGSHVCHFNESYIETALELKASLNQIRVDMWHPLCIQLPSQDLLEEFLCLLPKLCLTWGVQLNRRSLITYGDNSEGFGRKRVSVYASQLGADSYL